MTVKKPSAKPAKAAKTVSEKVAKPAARPAARTTDKPATAAAPKPVTAKEKAVPRKTATAAAKPAEKPATAKKKPAPQAAPVSDADADLDMNPSLLSGPRNVQPYQVRKGEEYMSKEQLDHFRSILSAWKSDLMQEVDRTVLHMKDEAANFPDPNDRATQESEFSLELRTRDRERKLIRKIDEALKRIEDGSYGFCLETGEPIGVKRLEARPVATLSVEAQERRERREKQFGDRDDFYR
jgi:DnaK suppressor protein